MIRGRSGGGINYIQKEKLKIIYFRIINRFVRKGKKDFIFNLFISAFFLIKRLRKRSFRRIVDRFFFLLRPLLQLRPLFSSGIIYQLPATLDVPKEYTMAVFWFYKAILGRTEYMLSDRIFNELVELFMKKGNAIELKKDYYKLIVQNRILLYRFKNKHRI